MDVETREDLFEEHSELTRRLAKLKAFIEAEYLLDKLSEEDQVDLKEQFIHMGSYHGVLSRRIARHLGDVEGS